MAKADKTLAKMRTNPANIRYGELVRVCDEWFGSPRQNGTSHAVYRTPWAGDPRVNIQQGKNGLAKPYQVKQVVAAIDKMIAERTNGQDNAGNDDGGENDDEG
ncbi:toxin HicA [Microlunatus sp. Y2014]|uniref:toxin HicA n=1 Tax=Microlunatus sp. Y2014 TaxID=3418488 RepID=UPI003DA6D1CC